MTENRRLGHGIVADDATEAVALRHLNDVHGPVLLAYINRLTRGNIHWSQDILQETLLRAWSHPGARNNEGRWNRAWLFTVARRITIDHIRSIEARPVEYLDDRIDAYDGGSDEFDRWLDRQEIHAALTRLPERQRNVLIEVFFHDRSIEDVAKILDVPPGTVKSRTHYALRALREQLVDRQFLSAPSSPTRTDTSSTR